jgi:hypothetical protein
MVVVDVVVVDDEVVEPSVSSPEQPTMRADASAMAVAAKRRRE